MTAMHRHRIEEAFAAADAYDRNARVQRRVAELLADQIAATNLPARPRILEIGCGTGFLTDALMRRGIKGDWLITDIAPAMIARCRDRIGDGPDRRFSRLDGEYGTPEGAGSFDLVCSSLVMQWFEDPAAALGRMLRWLAPGGQCLFATLGANSFAEWRAAHMTVGLAPGTPDFSSVGELEAATPEGWRGALAVHDMVERHADALDFMRSLKAIGAGTASSDHKPLAPADLRRVMRCFEEGGAAVTYEVVIGHYGPPGVSAS